VQVIAQWTGGQADALRRALRMTIEAFAGDLGIAPRTVAYWRKQPTIIPQPGQQEALDAALEAAPDRAKAQFAMLVGESHAKDGEVNGRVQPFAGSLDIAEIDPDEQGRVRSVVQTPSHLDSTTVEHLTRALYAQRHAEDTLGPKLMIGPMKAQSDTLVTLLRDAYGPNRPALMHLVADWMTFIGWLQTALREFPEADATFGKVEEIADELEDGILASTGTSYRGYLALLEGRHRAAVRATVAALATPGAHPTQLAYDTMQAAQAYAGMGDVSEAKSLLHRASDLVTDAGDPPQSLYWYTTPFLRMNIGMTQHAIGQNRDAVDSISSGMSELPADQQNAEWLGEYQQALGDAHAQSE
jgi:hypothetical protein